MTAASRLRQVWIIARLEMRRAFFSKRALWVYLLALFPAVIFIGNAVDVLVKRSRHNTRGDSGFRPQKRCRRTGALPDRQADRGQHPDDLGVENRRDPRTRRQEGL